MGKDNANLLFFEDKVIVILAEIESALFGRVGKGVASHLPDIPFLFWSSNFHFQVCWEQVSPFRMSQCSRMEGKRISETNESGIYGKNTLFALVSCHFHILKNKIDKLN